MPLDGMDVTCTIPGGGTLLVPLTYLPGGPVNATVGELKQHLKQVLGPNTHSSVKCCPTKLLGDDELANRQQEGYCPGGRVEFKLLPSPSAAGAWSIADASSFELVEKGRCIQVVTDNSQLLRLMEPGYHIEAKIRPTNDKPFEITLQTLTGKAIKLYVKLHMSVQEVKEAVQDKEGIPPDQQRFIFDGKQLADDSLLADAGIEAGSKLHLVMRIRGGMLQETSGRSNMREVSRELDPVTVTVVLPGGGRAVVDCDYDDTGAAIKARIAAAFPGLGQCARG